VRPAARAAKRTIAEELLALPPGTEASCGAAVAGVDVPAAANVALAPSRLRRPFGTDAPCLSSAPRWLGCARFFAFGFAGAAAVDCSTGAGVDVDWTGGVDVVVGGGVEDWVGAGSGELSGEGSGFGVEGSGAGSAPLATGTNVGAVSAVASAKAIMTMRTRP